MKLEAKQINKLIAGFVNIPTISITNGTSGIDVSTQLIAALVTASFGGTALPNIRSTSEVEAGIVISGSTVENIVLIDQTPSLSKITYNQKTIFGKLTYVGSAYILSFYYLDLAGTHISYTLTNNYNVTLKIPYRFELESLPTDVIIKIKQWWLNEGNGGSINSAGSLSTWEQNITTVKSLAVHDNGCDVGSYDDKAIYEYDASSTATPDDDFVLLPNNVDIGDPGRWLKKLQLDTIYYINPLPTPIDVGGVIAGSTFPSPGKTMQQMWDTLLYPYQYPSFSIFTLSGTGIYSRDFEVGESIPIGNKTFNWITNNPANIKPNIISISGPGFTTVTGLADDSTQVINFTSPVVLNAPGSETWIITGVDTEENTFSKTLVKNWVWMIYFGESNLSSLLPGEVTALRIENLGTTYVRTWAYVADVQKYKYLCFPAAWGTPTLFRDAATMLQVPFILADTISVVNTFGVSASYSIWRSYEKLGGAINILVS